MAADTDAALEVLAAELAAQCERLVEEGIAAMRAEVPAFFVRDGDPDFVDNYRRSYQEQLRFLFTGMAGERSLDGCDPPAIALWEARMTAARGIPLEAIQHGYRIAHRLLLDEVLQRDLDGDARREASRWLFAYFDWVSAHASAAYARERERLVRDRDERRRRLVEQVLGGRTVDAGALGYDLAGTHTGVIAWGPRAREAVAALGARTLHVPGTETTRWAWVSGAPALAGVDGARFAVGAPAAGVDGFRRTHREAWAAYRVARETDAPVTHYADVALSALALHDREAARDFVVRELGPLAAPDARRSALRDTLAAYFAAGDNGVAAARALGVHERTVSYRLRRIEEELGHPVRRRRDELAVAVRLAPFVVPS